MWGAITILVLFFGGYYALSYREKMLSDYKIIEQERIKYE